MKILLTGSSGRLGMAILKESARFGQEKNIAFEFVEMDVSESTFTPPSSQFHQGSFADAALMEKVLPGCDAVIHTAAYHGRFLKSRTPTEFVEMNAGGLATMLEACVKYGVRRFVFSSTMEILIGRDWAASGMARLDESYPPRCDSIYSLSKLQCELLGEYYAARKGIEFIALRYQNLASSEASPLGLLARDVQLTDAARANLLAATVKDVSYEMMLIGPATPLNNQDIVAAQSAPQQVIEKYWPGAMKVLLDQNLSPQPGNFWPPLNIDRARRVLGWRPEHTFENWLRGQGWG
jgi:nucleoside-diphosphate-sugar epimerase